MKIIDHDPYSWFLLRDGNEDYLSVRCQQSFMEYSMLIRLTLAERESYRTSGHAYADALAMDINDHPSRYRERDVEKELGSQVTQSVVAWRTANEDRSL